MPPLPSSPSAPVYTPPPSASFGVTKIVVAALVGILLVLGAAWYAVTHLASQPSASGSVRMVLGVVPLGTLFEAGTLSDSNTLTPVLPSGIPGRTVLDGVTAGDTDYYLVLSEDGSSSNLYAHTGGEWKPLTSSMTMKFGLSYDAISNTFAYVSAALPAPLTDRTRSASFSVADWKITVLTQDGKETRLYIGGAHPQILPGGAFVMTTYAGATVLLDVGAGTSMELLDHDGVFSVSGDGSVLASYNTVTSAIDMYTFAGTALSYTSSREVTAAPRALAYRGYELLAAYIDDRGIVIESVMSGEILTILENPVPEQSIQHISIDQ